MLYAAYKQIKSGRKLAAILADFLCAVYAGVIPLGGNIDKR